jgi:hypothetical protein
MGGMSYLNLGTPLLNGTIDYQKSLPQTVAGVIS